MTRPRVGGGKFLLRRARRIKYTPQVRPAGRQKKNYAVAPLRVAVSRAFTQQSCDSRNEADASRGSAATQCDCVASFRTHAAAPRFAHLVLRLSAVHFTTSRRFAPRLAGTRAPVGATRAIYC